MVQISKPMIEDPIAENLRMVYGQSSYGRAGGGPWDNPLLPDRLGALLLKLAARHPCKSEGGRRA